MPHGISDKKRTRQPLTTRKTLKNQLKSVPEIGVPAESADEGQGHSYLSLLGMTALETPQLIERIHAGLPVQVLTEFARNTGFAPEVCAKSAQIPLASIRRRKPEGRLHPDESARLVRNARVYAKRFDYLPVTRNKRADG